MSQQILYHWIKFEYNVEAERIADYVSFHSTMSLFDTFVRELKNHLDNKCNNYYLSDPAPHYVRIANEFNKKNFKIFKNALQKNSIDETTLKTNLYHYSYNAEEQSDYIAAVELYGRFGIMTEELIQMLEWGY